MQRFLDKIKVNEETGCWEWQAALRGKTGYGVFKLNGKTIDTHRVSYALHVGPIPDGMLVCHTCDNRICVNPAHLFLGTYIDNMQDCRNKGRLKFPEGVRFIKGNIPINASLSKAEIVVIKEAIKIKTGSLKQLAETLNLPYQRLKDINCGRIYK